MALHAGLGVSPWDVLHVGLGRHLHIATGTAMIGTGVVVLVLGLLLGVRPGLGTVGDILIVGNVLNLLYAHDPILNATHWNFVSRVALFSFGTALTGLGIAIYIGAHVGAGPRDGLMVAFHQRFGWPVWKARLAVEAIGLVAGLLLRGPVGLGTLIWTLLLGWSAGIWFRVLHLTPDFVERGELVID
jgi:uncharacterized membrane protein YczE